MAGDVAPEIELRVALSTISDREAAEALARALVEERVTACVNIVPGVTSVYRWQGDIERDEELLLVIKTRADRVNVLRERLLALHPYDVPEFVVLAVVQGSAEYLRWVADEVL